jgi:hypothetical protein
MITISLFVAILLITILTVWLIKEKLQDISRDEFPSQTIDLRSWVNIISITVSVVSNIQLLAFIFEPTNNPAKHITLPFVLSDIPFSFLVTFWIAFGTAVFWFLSMMVLLVLVKHSADLTTVNAFFIDLVITVLSPLIVNALYLVILKQLFAAFACTYEPHGSRMTLIAYPSLTCWTDHHFELMGASFLALCLYYPTVLRALPLAQAMKVHYEGYSRHIVYLPKYLVFEAQVKLLLTLTKTFFHNRIIDLSALGACIVMLLLLQVYYKPCVSSPKVNLWRVVGYIMILCAVGSGIVSVEFPDHTLLNLIGLCAVWVVVLFFAVFIHRAKFNAYNTKAKFKSLKVDLNRENSASEQTHLLRF